MLAERKWGRFPKDILFFVERRHVFPKKYYYLPEIVPTTLIGTFFKLYVYTTVKICYNNIKKGGTGDDKHF